MTGRLDGAGSIGLDRRGNGGRAGAGSLPLGAAAGFLFKHKLYPTPEIDRILGLLTLLLVVLAWFLAFARGYSG